MAYAFEILLQENRSAGLFTHFSTTRMTLQKFRDVVDLSVHHYPRIVLISMHCNLFRTKPSQLLLLHSNTPAIAIHRGRHPVAPRHRSTQTELPDLKPHATIGTMEHIQTPRRKPLDLSLRVRSTSSLSPPKSPALAPFK
jgi:hypothetical protein